MFLPGEAFLYAAVEHDGALIEDCLKNRVIVARPTASGIHEPMFGAVSTGFEMGNGCVISSID